MNPQNSPIASNYFESTLITVESYGVMATHVTQTQDVDNQLFIVPNAAKVWQHTYLVATHLPILVDILCSFFTNNIFLLLALASTFKD